MLEAVVKYAYIALAFALLASIKWYGYSQYRSGEDSMELFWQKRLNDQVVAAMEIEKTRHTSINEALQVRFDEAKDINNNLNSDLDELRNRPERSVSRDTKTDCAGANGLELAGFYAGFLIEFAAKAADQDSALKNCYSYADSLQ